MEWFRAVLTGGAIVGIYSILEKHQATAPGPELIRAGDSTHISKHSYAKVVPTFTEFATLGTFSH